MIQRKGLKLYVQSDCHDSVVTDPIALKRIVSNLVANAVQYTEQGYIKIKYAMDINNGKHWLNIDIKDSGNGIPIKTKPHIFEIFSGVSDHQKNNQHYLGYGTGLATCKALLDKLGGFITCESNDVDGTLFAVSIPLDKSVTHSESISLNKHQLMRQSVDTVLVLEDDPLSLKVLCALLEIFKVKIMTARSIKEAKRKLSLYAFDLILADLNLSDGVAYELINQGFEYKRIICVTADDNLTTLKSLASSGFDEVIIKPVSRRNLKLLIEIPDGNSNKTFRVIDEMIATDEVLAPFKRASVAAHEDC